MEESLAPSAQEIEALIKKLKSEAEKGGYIINPDDSFTKALAEGLLVNIKRYGYQACPCRLADGERAKDLDIICPCDYRDPDLNEFGMCYCALYVRKDVAEGKTPIRSIPERRKAQRDTETKKTIGTQGIKLSYPVWRCKVCGYLCARDEAPVVCPICKADKDRFERFM